MKAREIGAVTFGRTIRPLGTSRALSQQVQPSRNGRRCSNFHHPFPTRRSRTYKIDLHPHSSGRRCFPPFRGDPKPCGSAWIVIAESPLSGEASLLRELRSRRNNASEFICEKRWGAGLNVPGLKSHAPRRAEVAIWFAGSAGKLRGRVAAPRVQTFGDRARQAMWSRQKGQRSRRRDQAGVPSKRLRHSGGSRPLTISPAASVCSMSASKEAASSGVTWSLRS